MTVYSEHTNEQIVIQVDKYTQRIAYNAQGMPEYLGLALPGAPESSVVWQIRKLVYTGANVTSILWCNSNNNFTNTWLNYDSHSYS